MPKILKLTRLGNPILREKMPLVDIETVKSDEIQNLIEDIRYTNTKKQYGVGLAAPQVGRRYALSVIGIKPTPTRPNLEVFDSVIINPEYQGVGRREGMWEGCQSLGSGNDILYGKALRFSKIVATWLDESGNKHQENLEGFVAQVFQHEADHLEGVIFIDKVHDRKSLMMADEYLQRIVDS